MTPAALGDTVIRLLREHAETLRAGALLTLDEDSARVRILPLAET